MGVLNGRLISSSVLTFLSDSNGLERNRESIADRDMHHENMNPTEVHQRSAPLEAHERHSLTRLLDSTDLALGGHTPIPYQDFLMDGDLNMHDVLPSLHDHTGMVTPMVLDRHNSSNEALGSLSDNVDCFDAQMFQESLLTGMTPFNSQHLALQTISDDHRENIEVLARAAPITSTPGSQNGLSYHPSSSEPGLWQSELVDEDGGHSLQRTSSGHNKYMGQCFCNSAQSSSDTVLPRP